MKQNKYIGIMMMAAAMLAATSCTDYSDYNDYPASSVPSADKTLWENIDANPQLSNFKALLQQAGFDEELKSSKAYTVWAPADNTFDMAAYQNLSKEDLLKQFVKSHVAAFAYPASGNVDQRVLALNEKYFTFKGDGAYTFDGRNVTTANVPATNGLMHITDGDAKFYPNIYEYIKASEGLDSLKKYLLKYELTDLNTSKSVKGPIVNGLQTYIDSVMETENIITKYRVRAQIDREDSSYLAVLPTDKAFKDMYDKVYAANNFITTTTALDVDKISSYDDTKTTTKVNIRDTKELRDSVAKLTIASNLFFSKNDYYYQMWKDGSAAAAGKSDTIRSTTNAKLSNPKEITEDYTTGQKVNVSNGEVIIVDSLAMKPWETYKPKIKAWLKNNRGLAFSGVAEDITVPDSLYDPNFECTDTITYPELKGKPYAIFGSNPEEKNYSWVHVTPDN
ncbi:MAG: fasciclin domain-containing protein, partial [Prevotella sp.]|nr:fasciclin domain-containing protein [Prevotella sp.]